MLYLARITLPAPMTKKDAISIFGTSVALADACGVTKSAVSQWPELFTERLTNEVVGAALRSGKIDADRAALLLQAPATAA